MENTKLTGLALSGGGVRAVAFHLGVLDKLNELGLLAKIDVISTVSGGSIVGAFYLLHKNNFNTFKDLMIQNLKKSIEKRIIFNWRFVGTILKPTYSRTNIKSQVYDHLYFHKKTLSALNEKPKLIINATNLATGKNWKFSQKYMGDWKIGYDGLISSFKISDAVAASSAVPGIFRPLKIDTASYFPNPKFDLKKIALCDGAIYDNQGIHALTSDYDKNQCCDYIICSDASFPFDDTPKSTSFRLFKVLLRQNDVMMARIRNIQFQNLLYGQYQDRIKTAYFSINWTVDNLVKALFTQEKLHKQLGIEHITSKHNPEFVKSLAIDDRDFISIKNKIFSTLNYPEFENYLTPEKVEYVSSIGTRLRRLTEREINLLMHHGSTLAGVQIRTYLGELLRS